MNSKSFKPFNKKTKDKKIKKNLFFYKNFIRISILINLRIFMRIFNMKIIKIMIIKNIWRLLLLLIMFIKKKPFIKTLLRNHLILMY